MGFRILEWRYSTICVAMFCGDIPLHSPKVGLIYVYVPPI